MQPHKIHYWLHSIEKEDAPEVFAEKVNEICEVYRNAQENSQECGHTILLLIFLNGHTQAYL